MDVNRTVPSIFLLFIRLLHTWLPILDNRKNGSRYLSGELDQMAVGTVSIV